MNMTFGKTDGSQFSFSIGFTGFSFFAPATRWTFAHAMGFTLRLSNGDWKPCFTAFRCEPHPKLYSFMKHFSGDRRVIRVGAL